MLSPRAGIRSSCGQRRRFGLDSFTYNTEAILTAGDGDVGEIFHHLNERFDAHQRVYVLRAFRGVLGRYLYYYFSSEFKRVVAYGGAQTTVASLRRPMFTTFPVLVPSLDEQRLIAAFLDRETAEIDAFIADQEELIALLTERRAAMISHAVTKGLDPSVPMKDSGVEWFGDVPSTWSVLYLKRLAHRITDGAHISPETEGGEHPFVSTRDIRDGQIDLDNCLRTSPSTYRYMVQTGCRPAEGDILFSKDGTVGRTAIVTVQAPFVVASSLIIISPLAEVDTRYLNFLLTGMAVQEQISSFVKGAGLPRISIANLERVTVLLPQRPEQEAIANFLDRESAELDAAIADAREAIALSKERRAALISAAVTGKIDVRGVMS